MQLRGHNEKFDGNFVGYIGNWLILRLHLKYTRSTQWVENQTANKKIYKPCTYDDFLQQTT